jgi:hypothetical protein
MVFPRWAVLAVAATSGCGAQDVKSDEQQPVEQHSVDPASKIDSYAVLPMDKRNHPKVYAAWGTSGVERLNRLQPLAALKAAQSPRCDRVVYVGLSETQSVPKQRAVFFVDCQNTERFYIHDTDLETGTVPQSQAQKMSGVTDATAVSLCEKLVAKELGNPARFRIKALSTTVARFITKGSVRVTFPFEASNALGVVITRKAECLLTPNGESEIVISQ